MTDTHTPEIRRYNMSRIRGKDTAPEIIVRKFLWDLGYRYRLHVSALPGKPDVVLTKYRTVIFVNGCFWHGHKRCRDFVMPKSRRDYWIPKIQNNIKKDKLYKKELRKLSWNVCTVWECQLKKNVANKTLSRLATQLR
jgi:DNA mismatch endonuclease (patch repair protein)